MKVLHKDVQIILCTTIVDQGETEENELIHTGRFYRNHTFDVLQFDEELEENVTVRNMITLQKEKVTIKRSGAVSMNQKFQVNNITENVYHHPHGTIHMETFTGHMHYQPLDDIRDGHLEISYYVKLNGQENRKQDLTLIFKEENSR
jgi:uncharacterized beta-barrel protein YwiB (DUF1934 family)